MGWLKVGTLCQQLSWFSMTIIYQGEATTILVCTA